MMAALRSMERPRILIMGYYGQGNFGDDVLMCVAYRLLKQALPKAAISVIAPSYRPDYVRHLLSDIEVLKDFRHGHFDVIVHGGGGVFFDYGSYGLGRRIVDYAVRAVGFPAYLALKDCLRKLMRRDHISADCRLGFGIGVGSFAAGSPRLDEKLPQLADFDALWVRDAQSVEQLKRFASIMHTAPILGSDLAFLTEHWLADMPQKAASARKRLGVVLRDFAGNDMAAIAASIAQLAATYDITAFIFDPYLDAQMQRLLAPYRMQVWQPGQTSLADFVAALAAQDVLLTSRFHGAICGACVGVPSVVVGIEPKLVQLQAMLPNASILVENTPQVWEAAVARALAISPGVIAADVARNKAASVAAFHEMQRRLV